MKSDFRIVYLQAIGNSAKFQDERRELSQEFHRQLNRTTRDSYTVPELRRNLEVIKRLKEIDKRYLAAAIPQLSDFRVVRHGDDNESGIECAAIFSVQSDDSRSDASVSYTVTRHADGTLRTTYVDGALLTDKTQGFILPTHAYASEQANDAH
jgi:hypothetical protein